MPTEFKKVICIDFDGVIHKYDSQFTTHDEIKDPPVDGAFDFLYALLDSGKMQPTIYSSRSGSPSAIVAMKKWFDSHGFTRTSELEFAIKKPAAWLTIDDRAFHFEGRFPSIDYINNFKAWNKK